MTIPLSEKYRPKKFSEIKGQEIAIDKLKAFITAFNKGIAKKKAILFLSFFPLETSIFLAP